MFFYNIAFSLEFIVIALGTLLISWAVHKKACGSCHREDVREVRPNLAGTTVGTEVHKTCHRSGKCCGTGFAQTIGVILIILAILNIIDTVYYTVKYRRDMHNIRQRIEMIQKNRSIENQNSTTPSTVTITPSQPSNSSTAP